MCKRLCGRFLTVAAFFVLINTAVHADPVTLSFGENPNAFSFTLTGNGVTGNTVTRLQIGDLWRVDFVVLESINQNGLLFVRAQVDHLAGPHGEPPNQFFFVFNPGPVAGGPENGVFQRATASLIPHMAHFDDYLGQLTFSVLNGQIINYSLHVEGRHCIVCSLEPSPDDLPLPSESTSSLPAPDDLPEPSTVLLLGTSLAGLALKVRKRCG